MIETLADNALLLALDAQYLNERAAELEARLVTEQKVAVIPLMWRATVRRSARSGCACSGGRLLEWA